MLILSVFWLLFVQYLVPFLLNQSGSAVFYLTLATTGHFLTFHSEAQTVLMSGWKRWIHVVLLVKLLISSFVEKSSLVMDM